MKDVPFALDKGKRRGEALPLMHVGATCMGMMESSWKTMREARAWNTLSWARDIALYARMSEFLMIRAEW